MANGELFLFDIYYFSRFVFLYWLVFFFVLFDFYFLLTMNLIKKNSFQCIDDMIVKVTNYLNKFDLFIKFKA